MTTPQPPVDMPAHPKNARDPKRRARTPRLLAAILLALSLLGAGWLLREHAAKKNECACEDRLSFIHENEFRDHYPPAPDLAPEEIAGRENQLVQELDAFSLGKPEIVDRFVTTTSKKENAIAPAAHYWREETRIPCWADYKDHGPWPARPDDIQVVRSACGRHDLFAFAQHTDDIYTDPYTTWGFFRLQLKDAAP